MRTTTCCGWFSLLLLGALGCQDLAGTAPLPAGTSDPKTLQTAAGALGQYAYAVGTFEASQTLRTDTAIAVSDEGALLSAIRVGGVLTDELQPSTLYGPAGLVSQVDPRHYALDARLLPVGTANDYGAVYAALHRVRAAAAQGIGALAAYAPASPPALRGHLYALAGYAEILLADLFCSGVPLSTVDFGGDFTYRSGSTTSQVYAHAVTLFDSALVLATDSARILNLARVGKGRALLALDAVAQAAAAVAAVPDTFHAQFTVSGQRLVCTSEDLAFYFLLSHDCVTVSDHEGLSGLPYLSAHDPRTAVVSYGDNGVVSLSTAAKYGMGTASFIIADGTEARLMQAEAALQAGDTPEWLATLNALRRRANDPQLPDTLHDPGTPAGRVALLFQERAAWLFLTGHRQGDLRRLIRQYGALGFTQATVYPTGPYPAPIPGLQAYGSDVTLPIPADELRNPHFAGCLDRGA